MLNISGNELAGLPDSVRNLIRLSYLLLRDNQISSLPSWIGNFRGLTYLDLTGNSLTTIPPDVAELTRLRPSTWGATS